MIGPVKKLPGVVVWLDGCEHRESLLSPPAVNFVLSVAGTADSEEIYDKLKDRFKEGLVIGTSEDLKGIMLKSLREDNAAYEQQIRNLEMRLMNARKEILSLKEKVYGRAVPT